MRYLSQCPHCQVIYHLSLMQMSISQGQVRCACCKQCFDAYHCFIYDPEYIEMPAQNYLTEVLGAKHYQPEPTAQHATHTSQSSYVSDIMMQEIEGSRLNLYTYLNYLDVVSPMQTDTPSVSNSLENNNLTKKTSKTYRSQKRAKKNKIKYYLIWTCINLSLITLLLFQLIYL